MQGACQCPQPCGCRGRQLLGAGAWLKLGRMRAHGYRRCFLLLPHRRVLPDGRQGCRRQGDGQPAVEKREVGSRDG